MSSTITNLVLIALSVTLLYWAYKKFRANKIFGSLSFIILLGFILRIFVSTDPYLHPWDERYHALVAKNLISDPIVPKLYERTILPYDYKNWTANHIWLHKPPVPLWGMSLSLFFFGTNEIAVRIPSIILSCIGIFLTFKIGSILFSERVGLLSAFFFAIHGLIIELSGGVVATDHYDIFFLFFTELSIFLALLSVNNKRSNHFIFASGLSLGLAILCKSLPALIVVPIWLVFCYRSKHSIHKIFLQFLLLMGACLLVTVPWYGYAYYNFPVELQWSVKIMFSHMNEAIEGHNRYFLFHFDTMRIIYGELIYLPVIWIVYSSFKKSFKSNETLLLIWIFIPYIFFTIAETKMQAYTLISAPALFITSSIFFWHLLDKRISFKFKWINNFIMFLLIALPIRYSIERIKPFERPYKPPQWVREIKELKKMYKGKNAVIFGSSHPVETMFYTEITAYADVPENSTLDSLKREGYEIVLLGN